MVDGLHWPTPVLKILKKTLCLSVPHFFGWLHWPTLVPHVWCMNAWLQFSVRHPEYSAIPSHFFLSIQIIVIKKRLSYSPLFRYYCWNWQFHPNFSQLPNYSLLSYISSRAPELLLFACINMACSPLHCQCHLQHHRPWRAQPWAPKLPRPFGTQLWRGSWLVWSKKEQLHEEGPGAISAELFLFFYFTLLPFCAGAMLFFLDLASPKVFPLLFVPAIYTLQPTCIARLRLQARETHILPSIPPELSLTSGLAT